MSRKPKESSHCRGSFEMPVALNTECEICGLTLEEHPYFKDKYQHNLIVIGGNDGY